MATKAAKTVHKDDFTRTFHELRAILQPYAPKLKVVHDNDKYFYLETKTPAYRGKPICFVAVRLGKNYVSFYLMAVYSAEACVTPVKGSTERKIVGAASKLARGMSMELKKRMQGKSCFNFKQPDKALFKELAELTKQGFEGYQKLGWI